MDLMRQLMLRAEASETLQGFKTSKPAEVYNIRLLSDAGLAVILDSHPLDGKAVRLLRLTSAGHDFLDAARNDTIWKKVRDKVIKPAGSWTLSLLLDYLKHQAKQKLGLP